MSGHKFIVIYSKKASEDLISIVRYIAEEIHMPLTAERFFRNFIACINALSFSALIYTGGIVFAVKQVNDNLV